MFATICGFIPVDPDYPDRTRRLDVLQRILEGTLYDVLPYEFHDERGAGGEYIPLRSRRPSVRYPLARIAVDDSLSLLCSAKAISLPLIAPTRLSARRSATSLASARSTK
jgi:hypothetical protein